MIARPRRSPKNTQNIGWSVLWGSELLFFCFESIFKQIWDFDSVKFHSILRTSLESIIKNEVHYFSEIIGRFGIPAKNIKINAKIIIYAVVLVAFLWTFYISFQYSFKIFNKHQY